MKRTVFFVMFVAMAIESATAAIDDATKQDIDEFIENILSCRNITGMNLAIVYDGETVYTQGYGVKDRNTNASVTNDTFFGIASLSKAFAATLLGKLLHDHNLTWDSTVREILGEEFYFNDGLRTTTATLRDLAAHTMGIPSNNYVRLQDPTRQELAQKIRFLEASRDLQMSYIYNNLMYGLISYVSEIIGGATWEELMTQELFQPIGMENTTFTHVADLTRQDIAKPYLIDFADWEWREVSLRLHAEWGELGGSGSVFTTANEMAEWLHVQLNGGENQSGERVLDESVLEETHDPVNGYPTTSSYLKRPVIPVTYDYSKYALGWRTGFYRGLPMEMHTGTSWGYGGLLTLLPDVGLGIYSSVTGPDESYLGRRAAHMYIADVLLGETPWLNLTTACTFPEPWTERRAYRSKYDLGDYARGVATNHSLEMYEGTFGNFAYGNVTVALNDTVDRLEMRLSPMGLWDLHPNLDGGDHAFFADGIEDIWPMDFRAEFASKDPTNCSLCIDILRVYFDSDPTVFERDLKMEDAPPPPPVGCDEVDGGDGGDTSGFSSALPKAVYSLYGFLVQYATRH